MKRFLFLILAFMQGCVAYAASPGTAAFNANQFSTNNNRISIKDSAIATNLVVHGELSSDSSAMGSEFFGDGGSYGYRITPPTMSGFINFIPDTSAQTGVPYHTNTGTNVVETHLSLASFGYGLWTNISGTITGNSTVTDGASAVGFSLNSSNTLAASGADLVRFQNHGTNVYEFGSGGYFSLTALSGQFAEFNGQNHAGNQAFDLYADDQIVSFKIYAHGYKTVLDPTESQANTSYILDTFTNHTSGNLLEVANQGTNKFVVAYDGAATGTDLAINNLTINTNVTVNNNITVKGNAVLNIASAQSETVSNNLTVLGNYVGTIDPAQTGTTVKGIKSLKLQFPRLIDGAGCTYANTNDYTALTFMLPQFSGTGATNANYCDFAFRVPTDLDTTVDLTASLTIRLTAADTAAHTYDVGMVSIANSSAAAGTPANFVALTVSGDGSGASGDIEGVSAVTLTSWKSNLTAGQWCLLRLNRDGANDASTVASNLMELEIFYTSTQ